MIITCDKCDTRFELDEDPEQLVDSDVRCVHCNAILDVDMQAIRKRVDKSSKSWSDASAPKTPEKEKNFLRTDMPGKKRKKKSKSKSLKSDPAKSADVKGMKGNAADTGQDMPDALAADAMGGGFLEKSDDLDFLMDPEEDSGAGDIVNEKTEVLNIDDYNDIEFRAGSNGRPDSGKISGGPDGADFAIDRELFLDFDLDGMGMDTDSSKGTDSPGAPSDADEFDEFDEMEPFAFELDDEFSVDSDGETIVLDMDMDDESEKFHNLLSRDVDKDTADVNSKAASPHLNSHGLPDDSDEMAPFSMDLGAPLGGSDKDGLLDLFLGLDMDQMKTSAESRGGLVTEGGGLKLGIEDSDLDADMASSSDDAGLGLDENLLLDMDLDFDEDEQGLATVVDDDKDDASKSDHALGESPDDVGLGLDENLLLDLDLDFDEDEQGLATVVADSEDGKPIPDLVPGQAADDAHLGLDDDLLLDLDLDLDFDEDEQGLATVVVDGQGENLVQDSALGESMNDADSVLDENLLTDLNLDLDLNVEEGEKTPAALEPTDAGDDSIELTLDLDDDDMRAADDTPAVSKEEFSLELLDIDDAEDALSLSDDAGDAPVLELETALEDVADSGESASVSEEEFSLELDIDDAEDALSLSDDDGDAPVLDLETALEGVADSGEPASALEEEFFLDLSLDDAEEGVSHSGEGADVPILDLEIAPEDGQGESALDSEGGFTLELDLDDISEEPDLLGEDADVSTAASETEDTGVLAAVDGDSDSEDQFLFNMDLEKFEDAPDELESTTPVAGHVDLTGELDSELTSASPELMSKSVDVPESFEVVEEILLSSDHDKNVQDNVQQDEEFIDAFDMGIPTDEFEELNENRRDEEKPEKITIGDDGASTDIAPVGRRRLGLPVLILLLALLGALLFWAYSFGLFEGFNAKNIIHKIPIVKEYFPVPPKHAGEIVTLENTIKDRFVENKVVGTLFVITGKVRNDFPTHRSHIQVVGKLFSPGKKPAGIESVYCGNSLTDEELVSLPPDQIKAQLGDKSGKNTSNVNVPPGKILPYMIVFHNLPETLEEYTVAVKGSQPSSG